MSRLSVSVKRDSRDDDTEVSVKITCKKMKIDGLKLALRGLFLSESFLFDIYFAQYLNLPYFPVFFFFSKYWNVNELDIFGSGEFHE